ncbi:hypothetical protein BJ741DRAFT_633167 [Chytriomyces cf. hyalinus JEL632]|nr:hypothetical protein BJ741DRAFT_633167 [Chytriomyces cf. hyalinus JEL632]
MRRYLSTVSKHVPSSGVYPLGFHVASTTAGLKKTTAPDMALVVSDRDCAGAAVFTRNAFAAAPVLVGREVIKGSGDAMRAVLVNAGCANACTGAQGIADTRTAIAKTAANLGLKSTGSTVMLSTGVIGVPLKMDRIEKGIDSLSASVLKSSAASHEDWLAAARAIMTTDTFPKLRSKEFPMHGKAYRIAGWSKGAGMIHPNMATMLAGIFTDAAVSKPCLQAALSHAVERSFNAISVDGDTSTNDTLVVFANGAAGTKLIDDVNSNEFAQFQDNLTEFAAELAGLVVRDGEGATKFLDIQIQNARTFEEGKAVATAIAKSPLVKTAMFGQDANWGRIVCAVGYSGVDIEPTKVNLWMESKDDIVHLFKDGAPHQVFDRADKDKAKRILAGEDIVIRVDLGLGKVNAQMFTCDLSFDYVKINIDYT